MKSTQAAVPNVFVKSACMGNKHAAEGAWVDRRPEFNGFSPSELWDHPELMLTEQQRMENPSAGAFTLVTVRSLIVRAVAARHSKVSRLPVSRIGGLPFVSGVRDEDPAPAPAPRRVMPQDFDASGTPPSNGHNSRRVAVIESMLVTDLQRRRNRHRSRPRSSAFRPRS